MKKLVLVETISMFRMRYVIECEDEVHACDEVLTSTEMDEFSQYHIDEVINSTRVIDKEEYLRLFNEDNDYLKSWTDEEKLRYIHSISYKE